MPPFPVSPDLDDYPDISGELPSLGILASGSGSNFEKLVRAARSEGFPVGIGGLICNNPGATCLERAERLEVPSRVIDHRDSETRETFDADVAAALDEMGADWVAMAGWMRISTPRLLEPYRDRIVNLHPSLLPAFRGACAVEDALEAGVRMTGCTVHIVTEAVDAGPILAQAAVPVRDGDDVATLQDRIHEAEHWLFPRAIALAIARSRSDTP